MHVIHVYDPHSEQSFFVNTVLLQALRYELASLNAYSFIDLADSPTLVSYSLLIDGMHEMVNNLIKVSTPPLHVTRLLTALYESIENNPDATTIQLATNDEGESLVPFAAVLLEYPVAYVPPPSLTGFLSGVPLDVYECTINPTSTAGDNSSWIPNGHTLLKFSCPHSISDQYLHLRPDALKHRIENHFASRVAEACLDATVTVSHHTEVHDRVAL